METDDDLLASETEEPTEQVVESPFEDDPRRMRENLADWLDRTCIDDSSMIRGRINANLASREVLSGIPDMDSKTVDQIVSRRTSLAGNDEIGQRHAVWLVTEDIVDVPQMRQLTRYITGGGDVFRGQIVVALDDSLLTSRAELVIDATATPPRQLYWKNLGLLGRGFPLEVVGNAEAGE